MSVDSNAKALLVAIQRRQGHVTLADIKSILPIESMTSEEIGLTIVQLEDAGINIEVDKELLRPRLDSGIVGEQPTFHSPFVPGASAPMGGRHNQRPSSLQSAPAARQMLSTGATLWSTRAGQIALVILVLIVLCLLFIFLGVKR